MKPLWTRHELEIATKGRFLGDSTLDVFGVSIDTRIFCNVSSSFNK